MTHEAYRNELKNIYKDVPFWKHTGCIIEDIQEGTAVISLKVEQYHLNGNMTVHGGVYATLLDNVMGIASKAKVGCDLATTHMNIQFLAAVSEGTLYAKGRVVHQTKRTVTAEARVETENGTLLALATGTFRVFAEK
jgi:uncharacterized protein (TIGR00369 family)